ncbi:MAG: L-2-hydroxyglutarate oxidase [Candidatus Nanopelagicales bacterium]|nr:L-2-hydroxyglutarate oxidase [Candidatus Nanopelagicales bacterium]MDZ4248934.1 L-2-hydroxyglutarate oxidase [Candidatus Nanopelagicales bacterium]
MTSSADVAVIGGGIVGLAVARQILLDHPGSRVAVFDKEPRIATHASGRNSGVLHAGFYYAADSLKARLTRRGNQLLREFCAEMNVTVRECGKVVVAKDEAELDTLDVLLRRARANGVELEPVDEAGLRELEPLARTTQRALWSPTTAVADPVAVVEAMAADFRHMGGELHLGTAVVAARPGRVQTAADAISVGHIVNCAGLQCDQVARWFGMCDDYAVLPFKGVYRYGNWPAGRLRRHVYPVPDLRNPFLGVHVTVTVDGGVKIGPTAIPALSRENYGLLQGLRPSEVPATLRGLSRFLRNGENDAWGLTRSELRKYSGRVLAAGASKLVPSVRPRDFRRRGRPGIRAQLVHLRTGSLESDFVLRGDESSTHVLNAVSPAWTSSLAVAQHVVADMRDRAVL